MLQRVLRYYMTSRIDIIGQNGGDGSHYSEPSVDGIISMDREKELEALSIACDKLANSCDSDEVRSDQLGDVLCCLKRVTNVLDLDWDTVQTHSYKVNEEINNVQDKENNG